MFVPVLPAVSCLALGAKTPTPQVIAGRNGQNHRWVTHVPVLGLDRGISNIDSNGSRLILHLARGDEAEIRRASGVARVPLLLLRADKLIQFPFLAGNDPSQSVSWERGIRNRRAVQRRILLVDHMEAI